VHLVFVVNHAAFFVSHRLPIALEALRRGWKVTLITGQAGSDVMERDAVEILRREGIPHLRVAIGTASLNPLRELRGLTEVVRLLRRLSPDIVHCASPKGNIFGGIAARLAAVPSLVLAVSGMGYAFTSSKPSHRRRFIAWVFMLVARMAFAHPNRKVIVQNRDDHDWVISKGLCPADDVCLIPGSGVDIARFSSLPSSGKQPIVVLPARLLRDKGVVEFVEAARRISPEVPGWKFVLAGAADYRNPTAISSDQARRWVTEGMVEWVGHVDDITSLLAAASIVCLPSHREGMPKALLEAAAAGCAVVTTDATGTREAIVPGVTGDLVPVADPGALAGALLALIKDNARREAYGASGKLLARDRFGIQAVLARTFGLYTDLARRSGRVPLEGYGGSPTDTN
jgi:glycosyltransferase involved in cell wall biosynthesis